MAGTNLKKRKFIYLEEIKPDGDIFRTNDNRIFRNIKFLRPDFENPSGNLGGWTINEDEISKGNMKIQSTVERILLGSATAPLTGVGIFIGKDGSDYELRAGDPDGNYMHWDGSVLTIKGPVITRIQSGSEISIQGWQHDMTFSATDHDTVEWTSGTITLLDGTTFSIDAGNTGTMSAITYIYFDKATSETVLQTSTTASNAVGSNKILICVGQNVASGKKAIFQPLGGMNLGGQGKLTTADDIVANTVTGNEITGNTLSGVFADLGSITAGNITLDTSGYIRGGQTDYDTGDQGFWFGHVSGAWKFSMAATSKQRLTLDDNGLIIRAQLEHIEGDNLFSSADIEANHIGTTYVKRKEIQIFKGGTYRIKFDLSSSGSPNFFGFGKIYRNGTAVGTERTNTAPYQTYSEDISGWAAGDLVQLFVKCSDSSPESAGLKNFRLYVLNSDLTTIVLD